MKSQPSILRDFTLDNRVGLLSAVCVVIGGCGTLFAVLLLRLIALSTNLFYFHHFSLAPASPAGSPLGYWKVLVPVAGGLLVGVMARFGSEKIRGHGIPEAIEAILLFRARISPKIAILKPISAAIAIGSGGPFGAEGPIIMTGGAVGSLVGQRMRVTDAERTTLLVAGAAAGMSATFATPVAAILLAVELLLFEWRPRSLVPVAVASATAALLRVRWLGSGPLFPMPAFETDAHLSFAAGALLLGLLMGLLFAGLSRMMYAFEDMFERLPLHWMWWPALGGLGVGFGGLFFPRGLGVGYDNIAELLRGTASLKLIIGILLGKSLMWACSLGSGTSGGVLAPLLMIGGATGAVMGLFTHATPAQAAFWALLGMGSMLAGSLGVPLTALLFSVEVTHSFDALLPLAVACFAAHAVTARVMPRSILTEKLGRRGNHLTREYGVDPLDLVMVRDVMAPHGPEPVADLHVHADGTVRGAAEIMASEGLEMLQVVDRRTRQVVGTLSLRDLLRSRSRSIERESVRHRFLGAPSHQRPAD